MPKIGTQLVGAAGEYHVAAELSRRGWVASVTPRNADRTDVLAQHLETGGVVAIQVKTSGSGPKFMLSIKDEDPGQTPTEWYVFVALGEHDARPQFFVVPRPAVAAMVYVNHREWLSRRAKNGAAHKDNAQRNLRAPDLEWWNDGWADLAEPTDRVSLPLPSWFLRHEPNFRLPAGHPLADYESRVVHPDKFIWGPGDLKITKQPTSITLTSTTGVAGDLTPLPMHEGKLASNPDGTATYLPDGVPPGNR